MAIPLRSHNQATHFSIKALFLSTEKNAKVVMSTGKLMIIIFYHYESILYTQAVEAGKTVNEIYYNQVLQKLWGCVNQKCSHLKWNEFKLHHDNIRPHILSHVTTFIEGINVEIFLRSPYSPHLAR